MDSWPESALESIRDLLWYNQNFPDSDKLKKVVIGIWMLWRCRNLAVHEKTLMSKNSRYNRIINWKLQFERSALVGYYGDVEQNIQNMNVVFCDVSWLPSTKSGAVAWKVQLL